MKTFTTLLLLAFFVSVNVYSQTAVRKYEYATVHYNVQGKGSIIIYYGNDRKEIFSQSRNIKTKGYFDDDANYIMDALNYMDEQGYELASTYVLPGQYSVYGYSYVFKREIKK